MNEAIMNWELQLAADMTSEEGHLLSGAQQARDLTRKGRYGAALQILWNLLVGVPRRRPGRRRAFLLIHMGHVYRHWMIEVALKFFRDAAKLSREAGFVRGEMVAECSLGQLHSDRKDMERALVHHERGLALARRCAGPWWQRNVLAEVVSCLDSLGHTERARAERKRLIHLDALVMEDLWGRPEEPPPRRDAGARSETHPMRFDGGGERCRS